MHVCIMQACVHICIVTCSVYNVCVLCVACMCTTHTPYTCIHTHSVCVCVHVSMCVHVRVIIHQDDSLDTAGDEMTRAVVMKLVDSIKGRGHMCTWTTSTHLPSSSVICMTMVLELAVL